MRTIAGLMAFLAAGAAWAQDDKEAIKKRILDQVEARLKLEEKRILEEISKLIDEELAKLQGKPADPPKPVDPKPSEAPKPPVRKKPGFLGIQPGDLTDDERKELGIEGGVMIAAVIEGSPAEKGGLKDGDIILAVDGEKIADFTRLPRIFAEKGAGATVTIKVQRGKEAKEFKVTLGSRGDDSEPPPSEPPKETPKPSTPESEKDLQDRLKKFLGKPGAMGVRVVESSGGVVVDETIAGGAAEKAGLKKGDVLKKMGDTAIKSERDLEAYMGSSAKAGATVKVVIDRDGKEQTLDLTFTERK